MSSIELGLPDAVRPISVDDHIIEPPTLWQDRLPSRLRERGPRVIELDDGGQAWMIEDQMVRTSRGNTRSRPGLAHDTAGWARFDEMAPGCYDPKARLDDMDADGVWGELAFPDFSRFAGHRFLGLNDPELGALCVQAYNDFVNEEWCAADPQRLLGVGIVALGDVDAAVAEVKRIAAFGFKAIAFSENPTVLGLPSVYTDHWEPLWHAVEDAGLKVCLHIGSSSRLLKSSDDAPGAVVLAYVGVNSVIACADWLFSGILERHPGLSVLFSEGDAGWVPYLLEQSEKVFERYGYSLPAETPPREIFARHMYACIMQDNTALAALDVIGADNLLWESDYPHDSGWYPRNVETLRKNTAALPREVAVKIAEGNARRLFGL